MRVRLFVTSRILENIRFGSSANELPIDIGLYFCIFVPYKYNQVHIQ